jgi:drug/metabolite transporter (DMT)-like permease
MSPLVVALVLGSALLHASWNALLRSDADRLKFIAVMSSFCALIALPVAIFAPKPAPESWSYIAASGAIQIAYCLLLVRSYRDGHLAQVYPIARGTAPLVVTLGAALLAGERLTPLGLAGVGLVSAGITFIALGRGRPDIRTAAAAVATGVAIASYMLIDGLGVRLSGAPIGYTAWQAIAQGAPMPFIYLLLRRRWPDMALDANLARMAIGAAISILAYGVVLWAMSLSPMGQVSALRETSILFAAVIGAVFLREPLTARGLAGAAMIATGAVVLGFG